MRRAMELFVRVSLVLVATAGKSLAIDKHWLPDLEWQTGSNWIDGHSPEADSSVIFPEETWHTVGLPDSDNIEIGKIYLPLHGSLALGSNAVLTFNDLKHPEKYVRWAKKGLYLWIDPENWDGYNEATPHVERIPCSYDVAVLPARHRIISMVLPNIVVEVAGIRIADETKELPLQSWGNLAEETSSITATHLTVMYTNPWQLHEPPHGFNTCHADESVANEVCSYMWQADKCDRPRCEDPLKVDGHCCDFCGGRLTLKTEASKAYKYSARVIEARVNKVLGNWRGDITWHVRNTFDGDAEILIAEKGEYTGINSQEAVDILAKALIADGFEISVSQATGSALDGSQMGTALGLLLGIPAILILLLLAVFPYYGYTYSQVFTACTSAGKNTPSKRKKSSTGTFGFARFKNVPEGDVDLAENIVTEDSEPNEDDSDVDRPSSSSKRFENPLYISMRDKEKNKTVDEEKMIDIDAPMSLAALESRVRDEPIEELSLE